MLTPIRRFRYENHVTLLKAAQAIGSSSSYLSQVELGNLKLTPVMASRLVNGYRDLGLDAADAINEHLEDQDIAAEKRLPLREQILVTAEAFWSAAQLSFRGHYWKSNLDSLKKLAHILGICEVPENL